jgi:hypothetical protein
MTRMLLLSETESPVCIVEGIFSSILASLGMLLAEYLGLLSNEAI